LTAHIDALPVGWSFRVLRDGDVIVAIRDGSPAPAARPTLTVALADHRLALLVENPVVNVPLTDPDIVVDVTPVHMTLTVELIEPTTLHPQTGCTVTAQATTGPSPYPAVTLDEGSPGLYQSVPAVWTAAFTPLDVLVDGALLRRLTVNFRRTATRVRLLDTT
jgi:hypothetical protein